MSDGLSGVISIAASATLVTARVAVPVTDPWVAVIVVEPALRVLAIPVVAIVATVEAEELQVTVAVRFCCVPSLNVPVAVNC